MRNSRRAPWCAGVFAIITSMLLVAGCGPVRDDADDSPDGLEQFYEQGLDWGKCDDYAMTENDAELYDVVDVAECSRLDVPLMYSEPDGTRASVAVLRMPARGEPLGSLVINPGGPGASGLTAAIATAGQLVESEITERFDIVGFDPRGVGATIPAADCYSDADADTGSVALGPAGTTEALTEDRVGEIFERCAEGSGGVDALVSMGTRDTARDLDVLRAALGEEQLTYLGQSYGTRIGAVYAEEFPQNIRAMVLDGPVDPAAATIERRVAAYSGFQAAFDALAAACAERADCPLGQDPARATLEFQRIMQPLHETPVPALDTELDFDAAVGGVIAGLYSPDQWDRIIAGISEVADGRGDELLQLIYDFGARTASGEWSNAEEAGYAVNCMDEERLTAEQGAELRAETYARAPFMDPGSGPVASHDGCEQWPVEPTLGFPYAQDIDDIPATLVVAIRNDPGTPYAGAASFADALGSTLLTVEGQGHTIVSSGRNTCVDEIAAAYLIDLELPGADATCTMEEQ